MLPSSSASSSSLTNIPLPPSARQGVLAVAIAGRADQNQFRGDAAVSQPSANHLGLPLRKSAAARADAQRAQGPSWSSRNRSRKRFQILQFPPQVAHALQSLRRLQQDAIENLVHQLGHAAAVLRPKDCGMVLRRSRRKASRSAARRARNSPSTTPVSTLACQASNFAMCSSMMASARGISACARALILLHDLGEVVETVQIHVVKAGGTRARRCAARPDPPAAANGSNAPPWRAPASRRDNTGSGLATEHTIKSGHSSALSSDSQCDHFRAHARSQFPRALARTVGHAQPR